MIEIRTMTRADVDLAVEWAAAEGWNPGLHDADAFFATDPRGFLVGELQGRPVATVSAVTYGSSFGFIGFYIVRPDQRGRGFGLPVFEAAMARLAGRNVGLDGVLAQVDRYERLGFRLSHRNARYEGRSERLALAPARATGPELAPLSVVPLAQVLEYDRAFFAADRANFVRPWLALPGTTAVGALRSGRLCGYGVLRPCRVGCKVGPLFADDPGTARSLLQALAAGVPAGVPVFLDVPQNNASAVALATEFAMRPVFETARMYTRGTPDIAPGRTYGITTFELG